MPTDDDEIPYLKVFDARPSATILSPVTRGPFSFPRTVCGDTVVEKCDDWRQVRRREVLRIAPAYLV